MNSIKLNMDDNTHARATWVFVWVITLLLS